MIAALRQPRGEARRQVCDCQETRGLLIHLTTGVKNFSTSYAEVVAHGDSELDKMSAMEREAERLRMVLDIKVKLQGWQCRLTDEQFIAVKELLKTAINRAVSRNDMATVMDALEVSAEMHRNDSNNVPEFVQRHL
ncbi:DENN domain and WD repeat-containing protein SCD1 [Carex littledalei]|uniref:DENN domain and WD repeat-containing protein SCD1 n=1 Tax=Carex littledalei TaxID=544730 RepID=A0A833Q6J4_9POAL|nr:DENN domain and WD repeat-containing protein SCD1 [Carex littledalei]